MTKIKSISSALACITLLSCLLASCSSSDTQSLTDGTTASTTAAETTAEVTETEEVCEVPTEKQYDGKTFTIAGITLYGLTMEDIYAEEMNGESLNDAIFERNSAVSEALGVEIAAVRVNEMASEITKAVNSGDSPYDAAQLNPYDSLDLTTSGALIPAEQLSFVDLDHSWWHDNGLVIGGKHYFLNGDIDFRDNSTVWALVFNKELFGMNNDGSLYDVVYDGEWTIEKMLAFCSDVEDDLDGDGDMDEKDRWGYINTYNSSLALLAAADALSVVYDEAAGKHVFNLPSESVISRIQAVNNMYQQRTMMYICDEQENGSANAAPIFNAGNALFRTVLIYDVAAMRDVDVDFGIVPFPKFNDAQENYVNSFHQNCGAYAIPLTAADLEMTDAVLDYMGYTSTETLVPAFYERCVAGKYTRDEESIDTLEIIFSTAKFDLGLNINIGLRDECKKIVVDKNQAIVSGIAAITDKYQKLVDTYWNTK